MEATLYTAQGTKGKAFALPEAVFGLPWNGDLVHQVSVAMMANARGPVADTKDRSEVRGGGKKPWKQKGTGRSRHGSSRSPIWRHGGVTHGPLSAKDYSQKINRKMRTKALFTVLSKKFRDGEIVFMETIDMKAPKTKDAQTILTTLATSTGNARLSTKRKNTALVLLPGRNQTMEKSFQNLPQLLVDQIKDVNVVDILQKKYLIMVDPTNAVAFLESKTK
jgi:large subunit ribosomal protein L4